MAIANFATWDLIASSVEVLVTLVCLAAESQW